MQNCGFALIVVNFAQPLTLPTTSTTASIQHKHQRAITTTTAIAGNNLQNH